MKVLLKVYGSSYTMAVDLFNYVDNFFMNSAFRKKGIKSQMNKYHQSKHHHKNSTSSEFMQHNMSEDCGTCNNTQSQ